MYFELVGEIIDVETIAVGRGIRDATRLRKRYGVGRWRKLKGRGVVRLPGGRLRRAELHWVLPIELDDDDADRLDDGHRRG
jgi:hypothetical protein